MKGSEKKVKTNRIPEWVADARKEAFACKIISEILREFDFESRKKIVGLAALNTSKLVEKNQEQSTSVCNQKVED